MQTDAAGRPLQVGILEAMPGPGRHFYSPLEYETQLVKDEVIPPGKIGVVVSKIGKPLPEGTYLVDAKGYRGILRKVLTPGRYRINTYAYDVKVVDVDACVEPSTRVKRKAGDPTLIPPGYVGVVTNKAERPADRAGPQGIQKQVLQPGIYFLNPEEKRIDIVSIGYAETSLMVEARESGAGDKRRSPAAGAGATGDRLGTSTADDPVYVPGKGIEFPSNDGFPIHLDFTAIWGILPEQAPERRPPVRHAQGRRAEGDPAADRARSAGSTARGGARSTCWSATPASSSRTRPRPSSSGCLTSKNLSLLFGLTRHIYVPKARSASRSRRPRSPTS